MRRRRLTTVLYDRLVDHHMKSGFGNVLEKDAYSHMSLIRNLRKYFAADEIAFLTPDRLLEGRGTVKIDGDRFVESNEPLNTDVLLVFSVNNCSPEFSQEYVRQQRKVYEALSGEARRIINPFECWDRIDKSNIYRFGETLLPKRYEARTWSDLETLAKEQGQVVMKHRRGASGIGVYLVTPSNIAEIRQKIEGEIDEYVVQEALNITGEKRLYLIGGELVAAKVTYGRNKPWDGPEWDDFKSFRSQVRVPYIPTVDEAEIANDLFRSIDLDFGAVDFVDSDSGTKVLEANIICPGLVAQSHPTPGLIYDLGERFVRYLKKLADQTQKTYHVGHYAMEANL